MTEQTNNSNSEEETSGGNLWGLCSLRQKGLLAQVVVLKGHNCFPVVPSIRGGSGGGT